MRRLYSAIVLGALALAPARPLLAQERPGSPRSEQTALALSLGGTLAPFVLLRASVVVDPASALILRATGIVIGPSLGHFYSGRPVRAVAGLVVRAGGLALFMSGIRNTPPCYWDGRPCPGTDAIWLGIIVVGASAIYDIASAPASAREYNRQYKVSVAPTIEGARVGLAVRVWF